MFNTLSSFTTVFFILAAILIALVIFEKQCLAFEEKFDAWWEARKSNNNKNNARR